MENPTYCDLPKTYNFQIYLDYLIKNGLAKTTTRSKFLSITYIVKSTKMQKGQTPLEELALKKNNITSSESTVKMLDT
jgi:hypothetical protein